MKTLRVWSISLLMLVYGIPITAFAQAGPEAFSLPDGIAGETYRASLESVLRVRYGLKLETGASASVFRWALLTGEIPPGLVVRANGIVIGTPRAPRDESYRFQLKVVDLATPSAEALRLDFNVKISGTRIRLTRTNSPKLVAVETPQEAAHLIAGRREEEPSSVSDRKMSERVEAVPDMAPNIVRIADESGSRFLIRDRGVSASNAAFVEKGSVRSRFLRAVAPPVPCDKAKAPQPTTNAGPNVYLLDARNGNVIDTSAMGSLNDTAHMRLVTSQQRFKKGDQVTIIVDNKNPYLYQYKYSSAKTQVNESIIAQFLPLIGGPIADVMGTSTNPTNAADTAKAISDAAKEKARAAAANPRAAVVPIKDPCEGAKSSLDGLKVFIAATKAMSDGVTNTLRAQRTKSKVLTDNYNSDKAHLYALNRTREDLYCDSFTFMQDTDFGSGANPSVSVDPVTLDQLKENLAELKSRGGRIEEMVQAIREDFPDCAKTVSGDLRNNSAYAKELSQTVDQQSKVLDKIVQDLATVVNGRRSVQSVLDNPMAFHEEHSEGNFTETTIDSLKLEVTPIQGVSEATPVATSPFQAEFKFGEVPFFSLSGGLIFSPLRKREFVRVQGFEKDQQGNLVLVNGKPNLTTVIGQKENSPTRITPAVFLNGRLTSPSRSQLIDGVYMSLGITAKNDNKGTDVEFLLGPSVSMFEHNMFFTVGGYAGRQQKLVGNLFEGFAVPSTVTDLPIQKNYRWNFGFALSYKIPVNKSAK